MDLTVLSIRSCLLFRAVADTEREPVVFGFCYGNPGRDVDVPSVGAHDLDVDELKESRGVESALTLLHEASTVELSRLVLQFSPDDLCVDVLVSRRLDPAKNRERTWDGGERDLHVADTRFLRLFDRRRGVWIAVVAQLVD